MDELPKVSGESLLPIVRDRIEDAVKQFMEAVNNTKPGELITGSEEAAREQLLLWRISQRGRKRQAADRLPNYVVERRDMFSSPQFTAHGWHIGSGPTEARCKTSTARLKRSGQRWNAPHAEAVAALTNLRNSDQWALNWTNLPAAKT